MTSSPGWLPTRCSGVHRALLGYARRQVLAGVRNPLLARRVRAQAKRALATLETGLGDYAAGRGRAR